jgi:cytochrome b561
MFTTTRFTVLSRLLHWVMAVLVLAMLFIGITMVSSVANYHWLLAIHRPLGISILVLVVIRLINRLVSPPPPLPPEMPTWQRAAAEGSHIVLYGLLFALPLVGWGMLSAGAYPTQLYGSLHLPRILGHHAALYSVLRRTHTVLALLLFATVIAHISAALMHALVFRDGVFQSMATWRFRGTIPALAGVLFAGLMISSAAHAQEWQTYTYPDPGFVIQFPGAPTVQTTKLKDSVGLTRPVTRYVVRQHGVQYTLSVVDYSGTNADSLSTIRDAAKSFSAKSKVSADTGARVDGNHGRELTITESDGSRSDIAIFFVDSHLYTAVGQALPPNPMERSADTTRFQQSLQFPRDDSGFLGLFGGRGRTSSHAAASTITSGSSGTTRVGGGAVNETGGTGSNAGSRVKIAADQRADAACAGKSAGDIVQLDTPAGPVSATCTLTARPNPPAN